MTWIDDLKAEPWRFNFYDVLRKLERQHPDRPRIGDSATRREEYVELGQDPFLEFPASNLTSAQFRATGCRYWRSFSDYPAPKARCR